METYSPYSIASYFLHKAAESNQTLTPMKVIKLVYLAHAWNLGLFGNPLFEEKAQAWKYGPVIPSLYHALKFFGNEDVPKDAMAPTSPITDARTSSLLDRVWDVYSKYSGGQLSTLTHEPGSPWHDVWHKHGGKNGYGIEIDNDLIKGFYEKKRNG